MRNLIRLIILLIFVTSSTAINQVKANSTPTTPPSPSATISPSPTSSTTVTQVRKYDISIGISKTSVLPDETFEVSVTVKNSGNQAYTDFEIRAPFVNSIRDTRFLGESPSFNRLLESYEYPSGLQSRSWIINTFNPDDSRTFKLQYQIQKEPKTPNGLVSVFTLPASWVDPAGLPSVTEQTLSAIRFDVYLNKTYSKSIQTDLPKLGVLNTDISILTLNSKYYFSGSKSTRLSAINQTNIAAFPNFTLETKDVLIEWLEPVDFSGTDVTAKLKNLDAILGVEWGRVLYKKDQASFLEKKVRITFKDTPYVFSPRLRVGNEIKELESANGNLVRPEKKTVVNADKLDNNFSIVPNITTDQAVIETSESRVTISAKTADPTTSVSYTINNGPSVTVTAIDLQDGSFQIPVNVDNASISVEMTAKFKNNETFSKIVVIKGPETSDNTKPSGQEVQPDRISLPFNQVVIGLIMAAIAICLIIGGIIYYLYYHRKPKANTINFDLNPQIENVKKVGNPDDSKPLQEEKIEMNKLKEQYLLKEEVKEEKKDKSKDTSSKQKKSNQDISGKTK